MGTETRIGQSLAGYRIEALLGRGATSAVYRAEQVRLGRKVALKMLSSDLADDPSFRERFLRESQLAASIEHPHIVPVYDAGEADGMLYIAMRYVVGSDLGTELRTTGNLDPADVATIVEQIGGALDVAHAAGLLHRDVKPGNILIERASAEGPLHSSLTDFGLGKRLLSKASLGDARTFVGTVDYVAPEQITGGEVDGRTDLYSLACVAYECLTGSVPFARTTELGILYGHLQDPPRPPTKLRPELPRAFDQVMATALAKRKEDRWPTGEALATALRRALTEPVPDEASPALAAPKPIRIHPVPRRRRRSRSRRRRLRMALAIGIAGVLVGGAILAWRLIPRVPGPGDPGFGEIFAMYADGTGVRNLSRDGATDYGPDWSPDGTKIAFASDRVGGNLDIFVMDADGSGVTRLTPTRADDVTPAWSPDGTRIAFVSEEPGNRDIFVMNADGSGRRQVTTDLSSDTNPAWSPDGTKIAFVSQRDGDTDIWVMNADGSDQRQLTFNTAGDSDPAWSPDGSRIAFASNRDGEVHDIWVMDAGGSNQVKLTRGPPRDVAPAWSPDGTQIAFARGTVRMTDLWVMDANGQRERQLTDFKTFVSGPSWSPDGSMIVFSDREPL